MADKGPYSQKSRTKTISPIKSVPHSFEAEQAIIGGLLLNNDAWNDVAERVVERDFYHRAHRTIFSTIESLSGV